MSIDKINFAKECERNDIPVKVSFGGKQMIGKLERVSSVGFIFHECQGLSQYMTHNDSIVKSFLPDVYSK